MSASVNKDWNIEAKSLLKAELTRRNMTFKDLSERLESIHVYDNSTNLSNKINRGSFSAAFLLQCLNAIDCKEFKILP